MGRSPLIGVVPDPEQSVCWETVKRYLTLAAERGPVPLLTEHNLVWIIALGGELVGAATTRLCPEDGFAEVLLVGGTGYQEWLKPLDDEIASWARREGMTAVRAYGRPGWKRVLGWDVLGEDQGSTVYERRL